MTDQQQVERNKTNWIDKAFPELANATFKFWVCPHGCRGMVEWTGEQARCMTCGERRLKDQPMTVQPKEPTNN